MIKYMCMTIKKFALICFIFALFCFGGCSFISGEGLLAVPKLPEQYVKLQNQLDEIIGTGAVYAAPVTGTNRSSVQFVDFDNDSVDEVVAFFRGSDGIFRTYFYKQTEQGYKLVGSQDGAGTYIYSVDYITIDSDGSRAIAVSWAFDQSSSHGLSVYSFSENSIIQLLETQCVAMMAADIDENGIGEIFTVSLDSVLERYALDVFYYNGEKYSSSGKTLLCTEFRSLFKMQIGSSSGSRKAVFVDSLAVGGGYVTDVLEVRGGSVENLTINYATGSGTQTWRSIPVSCQDIDSDGVIEVPVAWNSAVTETSSIEQRYRISWVSFHDSSFMTVKSVTFNYPSENWYLFWPEDWGEEVVARHTATSNYLMTSFGIRTEDKTGLDADDPNAYIFSDILTVYVLQSDSSLDYLIQQGMHLYRVEDGVIYGYFIPESLPDGYEFSSDYFKTIFGLVN